MSTKQKKTGAKSPLELLRNNSVPIMFILICAVCIPVSGFSPGYLINEILTRMGRNTFLILSLLIPIMAGMGLNFGMTLGAMAGQLIAFDSTGIDFAMTALFVVICVDQWKHAKTHLPALTGFACGIVFLALIRSANFILPALAAVAGVLLISRRIIERKMEDSSL